MAVLTPELSLKMFLTNCSMSFAKTTPVDTVISETAKK